MLLAALAAGLALSAPGGTLVTAEAPARTGRAPVVVQAAGGRARAFATAGGQLAAVPLGRRAVRERLGSPDTPSWRLVHRLAALEVAAPAGRIPQGEDAHGRLRYTRDWMLGFWAGALWQAHDLTGRPQLARWALTATRDAAGRERSPVHDLGFMYGETAAAAYDRRCPGLAGCPELRRRALLAADTLMAMIAAEPSGLLPTTLEPCSHCPPGTRETIVDSAMNTGLLLWAARRTGEGRYRDAARRHLHALAGLLVRADGSTGQAAVLHPAGPGSVHTHQGVAAQSTWARGQAWALYGFAHAAAELGDAELAAHAQRLGAWWMAHPPRVPRYDFTARAGPSDTSAAAVAAAGLAKLAALQRAAGQADAAGGTTTYARALLAATHRRIAPGPPLGRLLGQVYRYGGPTWDDGGELLLGVRYALEAQRLLHGRP